MPPAPSSEAPSEAPRGVLARLRAWAEGDRRRPLAVAGALALVAAGTVGAWLYLAGKAVEPEPATIELTLRALDEGEDDLARTLIAQLDEGGTLEPGEYGGPLYVLGVIKCRDADRQWSVDRRRSEYFVASKYLAESRSLGFPEGREADGLYLLGKSLIESRQLDAGVDVLLAAFAAGAYGNGQAHLLMGEAYYYAPDPRYAASIEQFDLAIASPSTTPEQRAAAALLRAEALVALNRPEEALAAVSEGGPDGDPARKRLIEGRAYVEQLRRAVANGDSAAAAGIAAKVNATLAEARRLDRLSTEVSRESDYLLARSDELRGNHDAALAAYGALRRDHGSSPAGIAASFTEGDLLRESGDHKEALEAYRRALDELQDPANYRSAILPISAAKRRVREALKGFVAARRFDRAIDLAGYVGPMFSKSEQLELRANTLEAWGDDLLERAEDAPYDKQAEARRAGRKRLREAGVAYEALAAERYASRRYVNHLWRAAEAFQRGQSYTGVARVLSDYLRHEPQLRNAQALLLLGEARLVGGDADDAVEAFLECLEFHPADAASYRVRLQCARAYRETGDAPSAERLLRENLLGSDLTPESPEWRDSLFELGRLHVVEGRFEEAITTFGEAVDRYPTDPQQRQARYLMAEAHRHAAEKPLAELAAANTVNERERAKGAVDAHLQNALSHYETVQRELTIADTQSPLDRVTLRNCYMLRGAVLFELGRYKESIEAYSGVATLYQNEPFLLEAIVQISHCWRRLKDNARAGGAIQRARDLLARLPADADFANSTTRGRADWERLLNELAQF